LFGLLTALWPLLIAQSSNPEVHAPLGIAFKPVVVFAVVAFFLWGFGFIWYLVIATPRQEQHPIDFGE